MVKLGREMVLAFGLGAGSGLSGVATAAAAPGATFVVDSTADLVDAHPGDVTALPAGHDAWVVGDEPVVVVDWSGASNYARA